jgi:MFS family permease
VGLRGGLDAGCHGRPDVQLCHTGDHRDLCDHQCGCGADRHRHIARVRFRGWFAGALSDRIGRVRTLQITIGWFAFFTFLCGFAQSYGQLFTLRALMGLGFGGEWAAAAVLMGEVIRAQHRGKAVGAMQSGWAVGWGIAALLATLFFSTFPQGLAWRALFWAGFTPALLVLFVRRFVKDPPVFAQTRHNLAGREKRRASSKSSRSPCCEPRS